MKFFFSNRPLYLFGSKRSISGNMQLCFRHFFTSSPERAFPVWPPPKERGMTVPFFSSFLFLFYLVLLLQTTWISEIFPHFLKPDLMLVFVVYVGTRPYLLPGAVLVGVCGLLYELFSGIPGGLILLIYFILFFLLKSLTKFILIGEALSFRLLLVFGAVVLQDLLIGLLPFVLGVRPGDNLPGGELDSRPGCRHQPGGVAALDSFQKGGVLAPHDSAPPRVIEMNLKLDKNEQPEATRIFTYLNIAMAIAFALILGRLWHLQIIKGDDFRNLSENNRIRIQDIPAPRGILYDREGIPLVDSFPGFRCLPLPAGPPQPRSADPPFEPGALPGSGKTPGPDDRRPGTPPFQGFKDKGQHQPGRAGLGGNPPPGPSRRDGRCGDPAQLPLRPSGLACHRPPGRDQPGGTGKGSLRQPQGRLSGGKIRDRAKV